VKKKSSSKKRTSKTVKPSDRRDQSLREHVLYLLKGGGAHISFDDAMGEWILQPRRRQSRELPSHRLDAD